MKTYYLSIFFVLCIFSCKNDKPETTDTTGPVDSVHADNEANSEELEDSNIFHIGNHEFEISESTPGDFNAVADPFNMLDTSEANRIRKAAPAVSRNGDSLMFRYSTDKTVYLINNNDGDDVDGYSVYTFIQDMPKINQWLVMGQYYEEYNYILIDKTSGDSTMLYGMPVVSPDNKYIITFNQDIEAGFTFNGFQLFEMKDSKPVELGEKELHHWGPDNLKWKDTHTLLVQKSQLKFDYSNSEQSMVTEYVQIKMK